LFAVAITGTAQDVQAAIDKGADVNARSDGLTPLILAAENNENPEAITALLKAGADIEARDLKYGGTVLMWAAYTNRNPEVIITLLKAGANAKAKDDNGRTALDYAKENFGLKGTDVLKKLEEASK
jgi:ankyrin repeat protein